FTGVTNIAGGSANDTLVGPDVGATFTVGGANRGTVSGIAFTGIEKLEGGAGDDTFTINPGGSISGGVNGGDGADLLESISLAPSGPVTNVELLPSGLEQWIEQGPDGIFNLPGTTKPLAADQLPQSGAIQ